MTKRNNNACLCLYPSNSSVQQPDSPVNNCLMCCPWTWTTAFNRGRYWSTALLMSWLRLAQQVHTLSLRSSKPTIRRTELRDIPVNFLISLGLLLDPGFSSWLHISSATVYTLDILFRSDSPRQSTTGLPRDRVRCVTVEQKISNRTDCPILVRKLFMNMFCITFFLTKEFNRQSIFIHERHVYQ